MGEWGVSMMEARILHDPATWKVPAENPHTSERALTQNR